MIFEDQLAALEADSRSTAPRAARSTSRCWSTAWPPSASRASPSTSPTASSPPTSASSSSPTRPATSSTPATWHRRLDRRPRRGPDRRAQGRADADPPPQLHRAALLGIRNVVLAVNKMDLVDYDQERVDDRRGLPRVRRQQIGIATSPHPDVGAAGDNITERSRTCPGTRPALMEHLETVEVDDDACARPAVPHAGAVGQPAEPRFPRLLRHDRRRHGAPGDEVRVLPSGRDLAVTRIVTLPTATWRGRRRAVGHADAADEIDARAATCIAPPTPPKWPTSSRPPGVDGRRADAAGPPYLLKIGTRTVTARSPSPSTRSTSTRWSTWRPSTLESTRSACATST
jgi:hypothetical protein